jgi:hypothetical protein
MNQRHTDPLNWPVARHPGQATDLAQPDTRRLVWESPPAAPPGPEGPPSPQRAFYGNQFGNTYPLFAHYGIPLWVPEVGGPIDPDNEAHDLIMSVFGGVSKGERNLWGWETRCSALACALRVVLGHG